jgi:hypothetical protein
VTISPPNVRQTSVCRPHPQDDKLKLIGQAENLTKILEYEAAVVKEIIKLGLK